jgi:pimeloyl-ACP methyl ester carboxylesterase
MMPFQVFGIWLRGLVAVAVLGVGIYLLTNWRERREIETVASALRTDTALADPAPAGREVTQAETREIVIAPRLGLNRETARLLGGILLIAWSLGGGRLLSPRLRRRVGGNGPTSLTGESRHLRLPDGTELLVRTFGPPDGDPIVLTHGWGLDSDEWCYAVRALGARHRLFVWDLPGLGGSSRPVDRNWSLEQLARSLDQVIGVAPGRPVTLVGHSIGVMITLTYCRLFPELLGDRIRKLVLAQGTYTNPVRTTTNAWLYTALETPLIKPLCYLMIAFSPLVRLLNWMSYWNGSAHRSTERDSFSGKETRGQLDFITRHYVQAPPDVVARGMLAMLRYDATRTLGRINVPTLVISGDGDRSCPPAASRYMVASIPGAQLRMLPESRHLGLFEKHELFAGLVDDFLNDAVGRPVEPDVTKSPAFVGGLIPNRTGFDG